MSDDISIIQGESRVLNVTATDENGVATDLTGATIAWIAARVPFGIPVISKPGSIVTADEGKFRVTLTGSDTATLTGNLYHSATMSFVDGSVSTAFLGLISISPLSDISTVEQFKIRFPEFAPVSNALISLVLAESDGLIGSTWLERDRSMAQMLLAAHKLASEGEPARSTGGGGGGGSTSGAVKRMKVGDVEVEYAGLGSGSGSGSALGYGSTVYGQRYLQMVRLNFPGVVAV